MGSAYSTFQRGSRHFAFLFKGTMLLHLSLVHSQVRIKGKENEIQFGPSESFSFTENNQFEFSANVSAPNIDILQAKVDSLNAQKENPPNTKILNLFVTPFASLDTTSLVAMRPSPANLKFGGAVLAQDGKIYTMPYYTQYVGIFDPIQNIADSTSIVLDAKVEA